MQSRVGAHSRILFLAGCLASGCAIGSDDAPEDVTASAIDAPPDRPQVAPVDVRDVPTDVPADRTDATADSARDVGVVPDTAVRSDAGAMVDALPDTVIDVGARDAGSTDVAVAADVPACFGVGSGCNPRAIPSECAFGSNCWPVAGEPLGTGVCLAGTFTRDLCSVSGDCYPGERCFGSVQFCIPAFAVPCVCSLGRDACRPP